MSREFEKTTTPVQSEEDPKPLFTREDAGVSLGEMFKVNRKADKTLAPVIDKVDDGGNDPRISKEDSALILTRLKKNREDGVSRAKQKELAEQQARETEAAQKAKMQADMAKEATLRANEAAAKESAAEAEEVEKGGQEIVLFSDPKIAGETEEIMRRIVDKKVTNQVDRKNLAPRIADLLATGKILRKDFLPVDSTSGSPALRRQYRNKLFTMAQEVAVEVNEEIEQAREYSSRMQEMRQKEPSFIRRKNSLANDKTTNRELLDIAVKLLEEEEVKVWYQRYLEMYFQKNPDFFYSNDDKIFYSASEFVGEMISKEQLGGKIFNLEKNRSVFDGAFETVYNSYFKERIADYKQRGELFVQDQLKKNGQPFRWTEDNFGSFLATLQKEDGNVNPAVAREVFAELRSDLETKSPQKKDAWGGLRTIPVGGFQEEEGGRMTATPIQIESQPVAQEAESETQPVAPRRFAEKAPKRPTIARRIGQALLLVGGLIASVFGAKEIGNRGSEKSNAQTSEGERGKAVATPSPEQMQQQNEAVQRAEETARQARGQGEPSLRQVSLSANDIPPLDIDRDPAVSIGPAARKTTPIPPSRRNSVLNARATSAATERPVVVEKPAPTEQAQTANEILTSFQKESAHTNLAVERSDDYRDFVRTMDGYLTNNTEQSRLKWINEELKRLDKSSDSSIEGKNWIGFLTRMQKEHKTILASQDANMKAALGMVDSENEAFEKRKKLTEDDVPAMKTSPVGSTTPKGEHPVKMKPTTIGKR